MARFYSKSEGGFLDSETHPTIPADAVEITHEQHMDLLNAQTNGLVIEADENGTPVARPRVPTSAEQQVAAAHRARALLAESDIVVLRCLEQWLQVPKEWVMYREQLRQVVSGALVDFPVPPAKPADL